MNLIISPKQNEYWGYSIVESSSFCQYTNYLYGNVVINKLNKINSNESLEFSTKGIDTQYLGDSFILKNAVQIQTQQLQMTTQQQHS